MNAFLSFAHSSWHQSTARKWPLCHQCREPLTFIFTYQWCPKCAIQVPKPVFETEPDWLVALHR